MDEVIQQDWNSEKITAVFKKTSVKEKKTVELKKHKLS